MSGAGEATKRFRAVVNHSLDEFRAVGRMDLIDEVAAETKRPAVEQPVVLIAGETRRGKSSLVNALLRHPGLSPAGPDLATSAYLLFSHGDQSSATLVIAAGTEVERRPIPLDDIGEWATTDGNPGNVRRVLAVEVKADAPVLANVTIVDTPGHGGLDSAEGSIGVPMARQADAVVFVLDAGSPVSDPELAFLRSVSARVDAVIVVVTKIDDYPGWERIAADDRDLLGRYAPELANVPVLAVSARVAEKALARQPGPVADELWRESGMDELQRLLERRVAGRASLLRASNILVTARDGLRTVNGLAALGVAAARGEPAVKTAVEAERTRLRQYGSRWSQRMNAGIAKVKLTHGEALGKGLGELQRKYIGTIEKSKRQEHEAIADQLVTDINELAAALSKQAGLSLAGLVAEITAEIRAEEQLDAIVDQASAAISEYGAVQRVNKASERKLTRVDKLAGFVSFSSGKSIAGIATALPLVAGFGLPIIGVGLGVGAVFSFLMTTGRRDLNLQNNLKAWVQQQINEAQRQISADFGRRMIDAQENLKDALTDYLDRRRAELDAAAAQYAQLAAGAGRQAAVRSAEAEMTRISKLITETDEVLALLGAFRAPARKMVRP
ncbi:MAG TPA: dynamin family protein [Streptosporangiaceae bacterium]